MEDCVPWINSLLEKGRNPGPWPPSCHLWCAGASLGHTDCVKSAGASLTHRLCQICPSKPSRMRLSLPSLPSTRETSGGSTSQQGWPTWEESWGSNSCSEFESPWQMFAIPATSLILETKPLVIPDQSTPFWLTDSVCFIWHNPPYCSPLTFKKPLIKRN